MSPVRYTVLLTLAAAQSFTLLPPSLQLAIVRKLEELSGSGDAIEGADGESRQVIWADLNVFYRVERTERRIVVIAADER